MKVLYATFDEIPSFKGASTHVLCGLRQAIQLHDVSLVSLGSVALPRLHRLTHYPIALREKNLLRRGLQFRDHVQTLINRLNPDLIHFRSPWEGMPAVGAGVPTIYEANAFSSVELRYVNRRTSDEVLATFRAWERDCLVAATKVIAPTARIAQFSEEQFCLPIGDKFELFPNAFDYPHLAPASILPRESDPRLRLVYLGTLSPWQGVFWVLRALRELRDCCTLTIFAPYSKQYFRFAERLIARYGLEGTVQLKRAQSRFELSRQLPTFDAAIAPLLKTTRNVEQGCFPVKLLDYLAHGLPVLGADLFVVRQVISPGENGLLYAANSLLRFRELVRDVACNRSILASLRATIPQTVCRFWNWDQYAAQLLLLYEELAAS